MDRLSIAAAQTIPTRGGVDANLEQHLQLIGIAASVAADVLVFPELSLTGYELDLGNELAFTEDDRRLQLLVAAASSHAITLVVGAPVKIGAGLHIGALIVPPDGRVTVYTKHHLGAFSSAASVDGVVPPPEATFFQSGDRNPLVRLGARHAALAVCADTGRPAHARAAADRGATIYLASMFVIPSEFGRERETLRHYAMQHGMAVVFANFGGPTGGLASAGRSAIWNEQGELVAELGAAEAGIVAAERRASEWRGQAIAAGARA